MVRLLRPDGEVGRVWSSSRPLVYRALETLAEKRLVRATRSEASTEGPTRTVFTPTAAGRRAYEAWLASPVDHVRELRSALMVKLLLLDRSARDPEPLLSTQAALLTRAERDLEARAAAAEGFEATLALWRLSTARAALAFVEALRDRRITEAVVYTPIGRVRSPHASLDGMPLQPIADDAGPSRIEITEPHRGSLRDVAGFSHVWVLAHLHETTGWDETVPAFLDDGPRGTFATRSPRRPNPLGLSLAEVVAVEPGAVVVRGLDLLDGTPVLDLKPYVPLFDAPAGDVRSGWFEDRAARVFERTSDLRFRPRSSRAP